MADILLSTAAATSAGSFLKDAAPWASAVVAVAALFIADWGNFRTTTSVWYDVETWFDQEFKQA